MDGVLSAIRFDERSAVSNSFLWTEYCQQLFFMDGVALLLALLLAGRWGLYGAERLVFYCRKTSASTAPHPEGCAALRIVLVTVPRVSLSCEHFQDGFDLHLLRPGLTRSVSFRNISTSRLQLTRPMTDAACPVRQVVRLVAKARAPPSLENRFHSALQDHTTGISSVNRGRANMAHRRQSRHDSGLCFQVKVF